MNRFLMIYLCVVMIILYSACDKKDEIVIYGETNSYESWLFDKYKPIRMERCLDLDFNDDAKLWLKETPIVMELQMLGDNGIQKADNVKLYINDSLQLNNRFCISVNDTQLKLALEFLPTATEGMHTYYLVDVTPGENILDKIEFEGFSHDNSISTSMTKIMNPTKEKAIWGGILFAIIAFSWLILSRFVIWKPTKFSRIYINYNDDCGDILVKIGSCYEVVCTSNANMKDSFWEKIFKGKRKYIINDFWKKTITIKDGKRRNSVLISGARSYTINGEKMRRVPIEIINSQSKKTIIRTI